MSQPITEGKELSGQHYILLPCCSALQLIELNLYKISLINDDKMVDFSNMTETVDLFHDASIEER